MGSAFAQLLADSGNEVSLVGTHLDRDIIASILADGTHPGLKVKLPEKVRAFYVEDLEQVLDDRVRMIVFGVNSAGVNWAVECIGPILKTPVPILMLTKGLAIQHNTIRLSIYAQADRLNFSGVVRRCIETGQGTQHQLIFLGMIFLEASLPTASVFLKVQVRMSCRSGG